MTAGPAGKRAAIGGFFFQNLALYRMRRLSQALGRAAESVLAEDQVIRLHDWRILEMVRQRPGITATQAAPRVLLNKMQTSRAIAHLCAHGLLETTSSAADGRAAPLALTAKGRRVLAVVSRRMAAIEMWALADLAPDELAGLDALLAKIEARLAGNAAPDAATLDGVIDARGARRRSAYLFGPRADAYDAPKP